MTSDHAGKWMFYEKNSKGEDNFVLTHHHVYTPPTRARGRFGNVWKKFNEDQHSFVVRTFQQRGSREALEVLKQCANRVKDITAQMLADIKPKDLSNALRKHFEEASQLNAPGEFAEFAKAMQSANDSFDLLWIDDSKKDVLEGLFWTTKEQRKFVDCCSDVIIVDTTFNVNVNAAIKLLAIVGLTPAGETVPLAQAFVTHHDIRAFRWVFRMFLQTWPVPSAIISDNEPALHSVLSEELPATAHLLCLWHIGLQSDWFTLSPFSHSFSQEFVSKPAVSVKREIWSLHRAILESTTCHDLGGVRG